MNVLVVSSEAVPFVKTGGLADVAGALPLYLREVGVSTALMLPLYQKVTESGLKLTRERATIRVPLGEKVVEGAIWSGRIPESDVPVYFLQQDAFFNRPELYGEKGKDYADNSQRFIFFSRGCLEAIKALRLKPDVLHVNDWQTGLIPVYIKTLYKDDPDVAGIATLMTVHNLAYQGTFWHWDMPLTGLSWDLFNWTELEFYGKINFLKGGLVFADGLNTVSKTYAQEIQTEEYGAGLEGMLTQRRNELFGVVNGIDYRIWNPAIDPHIATQYSPDDLSGKADCKRALQSESNLSAEPRTPLIGIISRLDQQKGFDLIEQVMEEIMDLGVQLVLLGTGDPRYHEVFEQMARKHPEQFAAHLKFDNALAHRIEAGADIFLMPSRFEPCGLNQLYSLKYGTVPVVRAVGGLKDTIVDANPKSVKSGKANGFSFEPYEAQAMLGAIRRAVELYRKPKDWKTLMLTGMGQDWSWERAAREYLDLYNWTVGRLRKLRSGQRGGQVVWQKVGP